MLKNMFNIQISWKRLFYEWIQHKKSHLGDSFAYENFFQGEIQKKKQDFSYR